jgi:uncharacterized protein DUF6536
MLRSTRFWPTARPYSSLSSEIELLGQSPQTVSPDHNRTPSHQFGGWRAGILNGSIGAFAIFVINVALTIYSSIRAKEEDDTAGRKILFEGDCEEARKLDLGLHLLINMLSTLLLGASNYGMQCFSAPTRQEVDAAHAKRRWLDIGVLSVKNLRWIDKKRVIFWALLGLSSMPLHLL